MRRNPKLACLHLPRKKTITRPKLLFRSRREVTFGGDKDTPEIKFLGVTLDGRLTMKQHIANIERQVRAGLSALRSMAGKTWGGDFNTLREVAFAKVRSKVTYSLPILAFAPPSYLGKLDSLLKNTARVVAGTNGPPSCGKIAEIMADMEPLEIMIRKSTAATGERYLRLDQENPNRKQLEGPMPERTNKPHFMKKYYQGQQGKYVCPTVRGNITGLHFRTDTPTGKTFTVYCTQSKSPVATKCTTTKDERRTMVLETIEDRFPDTVSTVRIFTDGSCPERAIGGGWGVHCQYKNTKYNLYGPAGVGASNYTAECMAIQRAILLFEELYTNDENITSCAICSDSKSSLEVLNDWQGDGPEPLVQFVRHSNKIAEQGKYQIHLQHVFAHCGVEGNEEADKLAEKGAWSNEADQSKVPVSYEDAKNNINKIARLEQEEYYRENHQKNPWAVEMWNLMKAPSPSDNLRVLERDLQTRIAEARSGFLRVKGDGTYQRLTNRERQCAICSEDGAMEEIVHLLDCKGVPQLEGETATGRPHKQSLFGTQHDLKVTAWHLKKAAKLLENTRTTSHLPPFSSR